MTGGEREVVKLSLGAGQPALNVLPVGLEGETLTLVCPFPVLPVEVPVNVTLPGREDVGPVEATIRRVGVELMGESSIPRFKLQLALTGSHDVDVAEIPISVDEPADDDEPPLLALKGPGRATFEMADEEAETEAERGGEDGAEGVEASAPLVGAVEGSAEEPSVVVDVDLAGAEPLADDEGPQEDDDRWELPESDVSWSAGSLFGLDGLGDEPDLTWPDEVERGEGEDPPWTGDQEIAAMHADLDEGGRAGARWPVRAAVTLALIVSVFAVGYVMRAQIATLVGPFVGEELTAAVLGLVPDDASTARQEAPARSATPETTASIVGAAAEPDEVAAEAPAIAEPASEAAREDDSVAAAAAPATAEPTSEAAREDDSVVAAAAPAAADLPEGLEPSHIAEASASAGSAEDPRVEADVDRLRVVLPTRWPVREARSYRLHDPTGIVVDVPGGMAAERARWIDTAHERVRSVRVLEREDGVRFIIYLNDSFVPRYRVGYSRAGVTVDILGPDPRHLSTK